MKLKIVGIEYSATIRNISKSTKEVVTLEEIRRIGEMEKKLGDNKITLAQVQEIAVDNEKVKSVKLKIFKPGDRFKIIIKKVVEDID